MLFAFLAADLFWILHSNWLSISMKSKNMTWRHYRIIEYVRQESGDAVDGRNPAPADMVSKYPIIYRVLDIPGSAGFLAPSQLNLMLHCKDFAFKLATGR